MSNQCNPKRLERLIPQIADLVIKNLKVSGELDCDGGLDVTGNLDVDGGLEVGGDLDVVGRGQHQLQDVSLKSGTIYLYPSHSGKTILLTSYSIVNLPTTLVSGLHFKIITIGANYENKLNGYGPAGEGLMYIRGNTQAGPYWGTAKHYIVWSNSGQNVLPGDMWEVYCDGNYWYVYGTSACNVNMG